MHFEALELGDASDYDVIDLVSSDEEVVEEEPTMALLAKQEEEEDVPMPPLEIEEEQQVPVGPTEGDEMQQGEDVPVPPHGVTGEPSNGQRRGRGEDGDDAPTKMRFFPRSPLVRPRAYV